jgi:hypothetical protein
VNWARLIPFWAYIALAALLVIGVQQWRVSHYRSQAETFQSAVVTFQSAQETNLATIAKLQGANADWASKCKANQPEARQQAQASVQADAKRHAGAAKSIKSLQATYASEPTAKAWADTRVPTAVVRMLASAGQD